VCKCVSCVVWDGFVKVAMEHSDWHSTGELWCVDCGSFCRNRAHEAANTQVALAQRGSEAARLNKPSQAIITACIRHLDRLCLDRTATVACDAFQYYVFGRLAFGVFQSCSASGAR
jgi:hypothetical protein